jgi:hypothetical protein
LSANNLVVAQFSQSEPPPTIFQPQLLGFFGPFQLFHKVNHTKRAR